MAVKYLQNITVSNECVTSDFIRYQFLFKRFLFRSIILQANLNTLFFGNLFLEYIRRKTSRAKRFNFVVEKLRSCISSNHYVTTKNKKFFAPTHGRGKSTYITFEEEEVKVSSGHPWRKEEEDAKWIMRWKRSVVFEGDYSSWGRHSHSGLQFTSDEEPYLIYSADV